MMSLFQTVSLKESKEYIYKLFPKGNSVAHGAQ